MEADIIILVDYKNRFGSKYRSFPYRSGFDKNILSQFFIEFGYRVTYVKMSDASQLSNIENKIILYQSSEDIGYHYKSFIEDIIFSLESRGAKVIPSYKFLRANNNKVLMELIRNELGLSTLGKVGSRVYGCIEELNEHISELNFPLVVKAAGGSMSKGVRLARNEGELLKAVKLVSRSSYLLEDIRDYIRSFKHKDYVKESLYRNKFVVQPFIPNLDGDYKILIFGNKYYVLKRGLKENDFRASGSGIRDYISDIPVGLLPFAKDIFLKLNVPQLSIDIAFDGTNFHMIEFQCLYFGSFTLTYSKFYWQLDAEQDAFVKVEGESCLEEEYARSIVRYISN